MIDILVYLFATYQDFGSRPKSRTLKRALSAVGFEDAAISTALRWLDGLNTAAVVELPGNDRALRVYRVEEQRKLGSDGLGFIASLEAAGLLRPACVNWRSSEPCFLATNRFLWPSSRSLY
jgi:uncharacterized protein Smg (DUF494 family)